MLLNGLYVAQNSDTTVPVLDLTLIILNECTEFQKSLSKAISLPNYQQFYYYAKFAISKII